MAVIVLVFAAGSGAFVPQKVCVLQPRPQETSIAEPQLLERNKLCYCAHPGFSDGNRGDKPAARTVCHVVVEEAHCPRDVCSSKGLDRLHAKKFTKIERVLIAQETGGMETPTKDVKTRTCCSSTNPECRRPTTEE